MEKECGPVTYRIVAFILTFLECRLKKFIIKTEMVSDESIILFHCHQIHKITRQPLYYNFPLIVYIRDSLNVLVSKGKRFYAKDATQLEIFLFGVR